MSYIDIKVIINGECEQVKINTRYIKALETFPYVANDYSDAKGTRIILEGDTYYEVKQPIDDIYCLISDAGSHGI